MKKRFVAVLAGLMVLAFGATSVFAADSASTSTTDAEAAASYFSSSSVSEAATITVSEATYDSDAEVTAVTDADVSDLEEGVTYVVVIDGTAYEAYVEDGVLYIAGDVADAISEGLDLTVYADDDAEADDDDAETDDDDDAETDDGTSSTDSTDDETSPKMGEFSVLPLLAIAALAGVVVCGKKVKFYA